MAAEKFDYEKYIWQIQFRPWYVIPEKCTHSAAIDYLNRCLIVRKTMTNTGMVNEKVYDIDSEIFHELLSYSEISKINAFENQTENDLNDHSRGYRDGWRVKYSYFTKGALPRTDGSFGIYDRENPL